MVRRLGLGGMATVYLAISDRSGGWSRSRYCDRPHAQRRLVRRFDEARTIATRSSAHRQHLRRRPHSTGQIYYTMPYLPGDSPRATARGLAAHAEIMRALATHSATRTSTARASRREARKRPVRQLDRLMLADRHRAQDYASAARDARRRDDRLVWLHESRAGAQPAGRALGHLQSRRAVLRASDRRCRSAVRIRCPSRSRTSKIRAAPADGAPRLAAVHRQGAGETLESRYQSAEEVPAALDEIEASHGVPPKHGVANGGAKISARRDSAPHARARDRSGSRSRSRA